MFQAKDQDSMSNATTIGKHMKITGTLASDGNVVFDGTLDKGTIRIGGNLVVGVGALIKGEVEAQKLVVNGSIEGAINVKEDLEIGATGKIQGDISVHGKLVIVKGGLFSGRCIMGQDTASETPTTKRSLSRDKKEQVNE